MKRMNRASSIPFPEDNKNIVTSYRWGWYGLSLFVPLSGILIGLFLYDQDLREVRKVGRNCLFIGFIIWVIFPLLVAMVVAFFLAMAAIGAVADMMPTD